MSTEYQTGSQCRTALENLMSDSEGTCQRALNYLFSLEQKVVEDNDTISGLNAEMACFAELLGCGEAAIAEKIGQLQQKVAELEAANAEMRQTLEWCQSQLDTTCSGSDELLAAIGSALSSDATKAHLERDRLMEQVLEEIASTLPACSIGDNDKDSCDIFREKARQALAALKESQHE